MEERVFALQPVHDDTDEEEEEEEEEEDGAWGGEEEDEDLDNYLQYDDENFGVSSICKASWKMTVSTLIHLSWYN